MLAPGHCENKAKVSKEMLSSWQFVAHLSKLTATNCQIDFTVGKILLSNIREDGCMFLINNIHHGGGNHKAPEAMLTRHVSDGGGETALPASQPASQPPSVLALSQSRQQFHNKFLCDILISTSDLRFAFILCVWHMFFLFLSFLGKKTVRQND